jgi:hypothetical protein
MRARAFVRRCEMEYVFVADSEMTAVARERIPTKSKWVFEI